MAGYRTTQRAVVHPLRSAKAFTPYCNLVYKNNQELREQLLQYMRQFCGNQKVAVDTSTRAIIVAGEHRYTYELIAPPAAKVTNTPEMY